MSGFLSVAADLLVAVLLVACIVTTTRLSRRMATLRADENTMRTTIRELVVATEAAERAISGLRQTVQDSDRKLTERLGAAARHSTRLADQVEAGHAVLDRVTKVADLTRRAGDRDDDAAEPALPRPESRLRSAVVAAREVARRSGWPVGEGSR